MTDQMRRRTRIQGSFTGSLTCGARKFDISTSNLSLKGLLCKVATPAPNLAAGEACVASLELSRALILRMEGVVARCDKDEVAVDFTALDEESYIHLRNIVRLSSPDPDALDKEEISRPFLG